MIILNGEMNLNWTKFKQRYLLSFNVFLAFSLSLYLTRRDFQLHWIPLVWMLGCFISEKIAINQLKVLKKIGNLNFIVILSLFYFLFFSPFSVLYRVFFRHSSFKAGTSTWITKDQVCDFDLPF